jgi:hypothetical protein
MCFRQIYEVRLSVFAINTEENVAVFATTQ